jgi:hypothetical protein
MIFPLDIIRRLRQRMFEWLLPDDPSEDPLSKVRVPLGKRPGGRTSGVALPEPLDAVDVTAIGGASRDDRRHT